MFNQQDQLNVDENYTLDRVNPIVGGDANDLKHLKVVDVATSSGRLQNIHADGEQELRQHLLAYGLPRVQFGARLTF